MNFDNLKNKLSSCADCPLCDTRTNIVIGEGVLPTNLLLIGEAPGKNEDEQGRPFIGRSGKLLDEMLAEVGLSRDVNVYITNICKCRPPDNRDPKPSERRACLKHLEKQIDIIQPKIIVCVGRIAAQVLIDKAFSVTKQHGEFIVKGEYIYTATFHPASVLRNKHQRPLVMQDFEKIKNALDLY